MEKETIIDSLFISVGNLKDIFARHPGRLGEIFVTLSHSLQIALEPILKTARNEFGNTDEEGFIIDLIDDSDSHFVYYSSRKSVPYFQDSLIPSEYALPVVLQSPNDTIYQPDITTVIDRSSSTAARWLSQGVKSIISIPLYYQNKVFGYVIVHSIKKNAFNQQSIEIAIMVAKMFNAAFADIFSSLKQKMQLVIKQIELEETEDNLKTSLECQRLIFNSINDAIIILDLNDSIIDWNPAAERIFGYDKNDVVGKPFIQYVGENDSNLMNTIKESISSDCEWRGELTIFKKDGNLAHYEMSVAPLRKDNGEIMAVLSVGRDITERYILSQKQIEKTKILQSDLKKTTLDLHIFQQALEQVQDVVLITTANLDAPGPEIVFVNKAFEDTTQYKREEVLGKTPRILQGDKTNREQLDLIRQTLSRGETYYGSIINYTKSGTEFSLDWIISPIISENDEITHFVSIQRMQS